MMVTVAVRGSLLTFWMHVFINIPSDVELIVEQKFNFLIQKSIKVGLVKSFPATALQFFCQIYCKNFSFILWMMPMQRWWSSWWLQVCIDVVSYPTRWSLLFIFGFLYGSSIFLTSSEQRNIVQFCTSIDDKKKQDVCQYFPHSLLIHRQLVNRS